MTHPLVSFRIAVCGSVLLASVWWKVGGAEGPLPVPSLSIKSPYKGLNIKLFTDVVLACTTPYGAPYPIIVFLGRASEPREEILSVQVTTVATASFSLTAEAQYEGAFLCWYNVSKTGEQSGPSNSVTITLSPLPPPTMSLQPDFIVPGRNYTVFCHIPGRYPNITLSMYYRDLQQAPAEEGELQLLGSLSLTDKDDAVTYRKQAPAGEKAEYRCKMEVFYSYHTYTTTLSLPVVAIAEEAPVRLVSRFQDSHCAGRLEMLVQSDWAPVCQGTSDTAVGRVVCRELGCGTLLSAGYDRASTTQRVRNSVGKVECSGEEAKLQECSIALQRCSTNKLREIVCSDFLPPPKLSVPGYGDVSDVYVHVESPLEISCTVNEQRLKGEQILIDLINAKTGNSYGNKFISSVEPTTFKLSAPVTPGQYACYATFYGFQQTAKSSLSNTVDVTTGTWYPPSAGLIVGALSAILLGAGLLIYICIGRVSKGESQDNATPLEEQPENSITSSLAGMDNPATIPELNTEISETPPGGSAENPTTTG